MLTYIVSLLSRYTIILQNARCIHQDSEHKFRKSWIKSPVSLQQVSDSVSHIL